MAFVDGGGLFELLAAGGADRHELLGAIKLPVIRVQHGRHREVLRLGIGQLGAEQRDDGRPPFHRVSQGHVDLPQHVRATIQSSAAPFM